MKLFMIVALLALAGCNRAPGTQQQVASEAEPAPAASREVGLRSEMIEAPASAKGSLAPFLSTSPDGVMYMSWIEPAGKGGAVKFATYRDGRWSEPATIVSRDDLMVNWADFPSVVAGPDNRLMAQWLQRSGAAKYAYDIYVSGSTDGGRNWNAPAKLHSDSTQSEHGFVSIAPRPDGRFVAAWLDGRETGGGHHSGGPMTLRMATFDPASGAISDESLLDQSVCDCCQTGIALAAGKPVVVYRDRTDDEIRDISTIVAGGTPKTVNADNWQINGCPVNGPRIAFGEKIGAVAWFTAAENDAAVKIAFSGDGETFSSPVSLDSGRPVGRVDVVMLDGDRAVVAWIEQEGEAASIVARTVLPDGTTGAPLRVGPSSSGRSSGFPRMALAGGSPFVAWTDPQAGALRVARITAGAEK
jgi:hypothetical protein